MQRFIEVSEFSELENVNAEFYIYKFQLLVTIMDFSDEYNKS